MKKLICLGAILLPLLQRATAYTTVYAFSAEMQQFRLDGTTYPRDLWSGALHDGSFGCSYDAFSPLGGYLSTTFSAEAGTLTVSENHLYDFITPQSGDILTLRSSWGVTAWSDAPLGTRMYIRLYLHGSSTASGPSFGGPTSDYRMERNNLLDFFASPGFGDWYVDKTLVTLLGRVNGEAQVFGGQTYHRITSQDGYERSWDHVACSYVVVSNPQFAGGEFIRTAGLTTTLSIVPIVDVYGHINLHDFIGWKPSVPLTIEFNLPNTQEVIYSVVVHADANGDFVIPAAVLPDTYDVTCKGSHWLRERIPDVVVSGEGGSGLTYDLTNGDCDGNNEVSIGDYSRLSTAYNSFPDDVNWDADADLDGDASVDIGDYAILSSNFGLFGDE